MRIHIIIREGHETPETIERFVLDGALKNVNRKRAAFFKYRLFTADAADQNTVDKVRAMPEVKDVEIDGVKTI